MVDAFRLMLCFAVLFTDWPYLYHLGLSRAASLQVKQSQGDHLTNMDWL